MMRRSIPYLWALTLIILVVLIFVFNFSPVPTEYETTQSDRTLPAASADAVSSASQVHYFPDSLLQYREIEEMLGRGIPSISLATVNDDGSPNIAMLSPVALPDAHIMIILSDNQTRRNLEKTGLAVATFYSFFPDARPDRQYLGSRLVLELVRDQQQIIPLQELSESRSPDAVFLKIVRILPLG